MNAVLPPGPPPGRFHGNHAIVIGASIGGLLAARVLSAHFDRVTVFDRDTLPSTIDNRRGVPQGNHGHGLLASGLSGLKALFPSLEQDLIEAGAVPGDVIGNMRWFQHGYYKAKFASGLDGLLLSRPLLEVTIRRRVQRLTNVRIVDSTRVKGLLVEHGVVKGVRIQQPGETNIEVPADFVVDSGGRGSRTPEWLDELGYGKPKVEEVHVDLGYTTRLFKRVPSDLDGDMGAIIAPRPPNNQRVGFMLAMEGNRWIVTLGGWLGNHAPTDPAGYLEFARTLSRPDIYEVIKHAEPLTHAQTFLVSREPAPALREIHAVSEQLSRDGRCDVQLQSPLRAGDERRDARGARAQVRARARAVDARALAQVLQVSQQDHRHAVDDRRRQRLRVRRRDRPQARRDWIRELVPRARPPGRRDRPPRLPGVF